MSSLSDSICKLKYFPNYTRSLNSNCNLGGEGQHFLRGFAKNRDKRHQMRRRHKNSKSQKWFLFIWGVAAVGQIRWDSAGSRKPLIPLSLIWLMHHSIFTNLVTNNNNNHHFFFHFLSFLNSIFNVHQSKFLNHNINLWSPA